jgi:hypothetical protein
MRKIPCGIHHDARRGSFAGHDRYQHKNAICQDRGRSDGGGPRPTHLSAALDAGPRLGSGRRECLGRHRSLYDLTSARYSCREQRLGQGCGATSAATSSSSGLTGRCTRELRSRRSSEPTRAAISKRARPTPPTLSRSSRAGTPSKATPRTAGRSTRVTSAGACRLTPVESGALRRNGAYSSWLLDGLLHSEQLLPTYAKFHR